MPRRPQDRQQGNYQHAQKHNSPCIVSRGLSCRFLLGITYFQKQLDDSLIVLHFRLLITLNKSAYVIRKNCSSFAQKSQRSELPGLDTLPNQSNLQALAHKNQKSKNFFISSFHSHLGKAESAKTGQLSHQMRKLIIKIPPAMFIDHINHNSLDNRKANLRPATRTQNIWHRKKFKKPSRSRYKGIDWLKTQNRWRARIRVNGKRIYLGSFDNQISAAKAYDDAAKRYHGQFAVPNFEA